VLKPARNGIRVRVVRVQVMVRVNVRFRVEACVERSNGSCHYTQRMFSTHVDTSLL